MLLLIHRLSRVEPVGDQFQNATAASVGQRRENGKALRWRRETFDRQPRKDADWGRVLRVQIDDHLLTKDQTPGDWRRIHATFPPSYSIPFTARPFQPERITSPP
jgi:hypothetical protein